jgi:hypothetical protein
MAKNTRTYWYDYVDIDIILKKKSQGGLLYYVADSASQNSEQTLRRINEAFEELRRTPGLEAAVIPINLGNVVRGIYEGSHWVGVVIRRNPETNNLEAFYNDSLGTPMDVSLPDLRQILNDHDIQNERITDFRQVQQNNGYDCGAWTVFNLDSFARTGGLSAATENDVIAQRREAFGYVDVVSDRAKRKAESQDVDYYDADSETSEDDESSLDDDSDADSEISEDDENSLDDDSEILDSPNPVPELEKLDIDDQNHIKFALNVPMYVPLENMDELSSDLTDDETFSEDLFDFDSDDKSALPFRTFDIEEKVRISKSKKTPGQEIRKQVFKHRTGLLKSKNAGDRDEEFDQNQSSADYSKSHELLKLLTETGFDADHEDISSLGVAIGLNRPLSLSTRRNDCLKKELHKTKESEINHRISAFFWDMPWTDEDGNIVEYKDVKKFYKQLKRKDPEKAKKFLEINEQGDSKPSVPYQQIREYVKDHPNTQELVQALRKDGDSVYFSSIDSDTKDFNGIYSAYLRIIAQSKNLPTVMSTGYEFAEEYDGFPLSVASKLERIIRIITAKTLSAGVYYPEPNICVLIPDGHDTLPYSFVDKKITSSTLESPVLLRQVIQQPDPTLIFSRENPLITSGDRAQRSAPQFSDVFQNGGTPSQDDLAKLAQIIQSTANSRDWALATYYNRPFSIHGSTGLFNGYISDLFKGENVQEALTELRKMVHPQSTVDLLHKAVINIRDALNKFSHPFEEEKIEDEDIYKEVLAEFYRLESNDMLTIIRIVDEDELYRALNAGYSLYKVCKMCQQDYEKFMVVFSDSSENIDQSKDGIFEDITYEDLENLYDAILARGGSVRDFEELLSDASGLFYGDYEDLDFKEITEQFLSFLKPHKDFSDADFYYSDPYDSEDLDNNSAYDSTVNHFADQFEQEYGRESEDDEEEDESYYARDDSDQGEYQESFDDDADSVYSLVDRFDESDLSGDFSQGEGIFDRNDSSYWYIYTKAAMDKILQLRLQSANIDVEHARVVHPNYIFNETTALAFSQDLADQISAVEMGANSGVTPTLLIPVNINNQHWVGMTIEFVEGNIIITYMDSEASPMPESLNEQLKAELVQLYPNVNIAIVEKAVELQKYNNCGLEVIENLIAAVAEKEAHMTQEEVLEFHSALYEQYLIEKALQEEQAMYVPLNKANPKPTKNSSIQEVAKTYGVETDAAHESTTILMEEILQEAQEHQENDNITVINLRPDAIEVVSSEVPPQSIGHDPSITLMEEAWEQAKQLSTKEEIADKGLEEANLRKQELETMNAVWDQAQSSVRALMPNVLQTTDREIAQETTFSRGWMKSIKDSMMQCDSIITKVNPNDVISAMNSMMELFPIRPSCGVRAYDYVEPVPERLEVFTTNAASPFDISLRAGNTSLLEPMGTINDVNESLH